MAEEIKGLKGPEMAYHSFVDMGAESGVEDARNVELSGGWAPFHRGQE